MVAKRRIAPSRSRSRQRHQVGRRRGLPPQLPRRAGYGASPPGGGGGASGGLGAKGGKDGVVQGFAQRRQARRVVLDPVGAGRAEVLVVDQHLAALVTPRPAHQAGHVGGIVSAGGDAELRDREGLFREAVVEAGERFPVLVVGVEVGAHPVDVFVAGVEVFRAVLGDGRRASRQRAPDHRDRRLGQPVSFALQRRQPSFAEPRVDRAALAAAVQEQVDAAEGEPVPARLVGGVAERPVAVIGGVDVKAAVWLAQRPYVGGHLLRPEQHVEADQVLVAVALRDRPRVDQLVAIARVGGGDVQHGTSPSRLPAFDRIGEVRAPAPEALDQRRMLVQGRAEMAEVGRVAGVADAEEDLLALGRQRTGLRACGCTGAEQGYRQRDQGDSRMRRTRHPGLIRPSLPSHLPHNTSAGRWLQPSRRASSVRYMDV